MKRCAALLVKGEWVFYHDLTIGGIAHLRRQGALIMHQVVKCTGKQVHKQWVTDSGTVVVERIDNVI